MDIDDAGLDPAKSPLWSACQKLPKTEIHLHLDGSLLESFLHSRTGGKMNRKFFHDMKRKQFTQNDNRVAGKNKNWGVFDVCNEFLQTAQDLEEATTGILKYLREEHNVWLCELRFCPVLHTHKGLSEEEAIEAVLRGFAMAAAATSIVGGVILCALRSYDDAHAFRTAELCNKYSGRGGVVGFDIAGDEGSFPLNREWIRRAKSLAIPVTVHAGEWPVNVRSFGMSSWKNLQLALDEQVDRIGHACQIDYAFNNQECEGDNHTKTTTLMESHHHCKDVIIECCLTSNVGWKVDQYQNHPIQAMLQKGLKCTFNCDNLLLSGSEHRAATPTGEIVRFLRDCTALFHLENEKKSHLRSCLLNGVRGSFIRRFWSPDEAADFERSFAKELDMQLDKLVITQ